MWSSPTLLRKHLAADSSQIMHTLATVYELVPGRDILSSVGPGHLFTISGLSILLLCESK